MGWGNVGTAGAAKDPAFDAPTVHKVPQLKHPEDSVCDQIETMSA